MKMSNIIYTKTLFAIAFLFVLLNSSSGQGWEKIYGIGDTEHVYVLPDGNFQLISHSSNLGPQILNLDEQGFPISNNPFEYEGLWYNRILIKTNDANFVNGFYIENSSVPEEDYILRKLDPLGNTIWEHTFGSATSSERILNLVQDINGDYVILIVANDNYRLVKIDELGSILWEQSLGDIIGTHSFELASISDGYLFTYSTFLTKFDFNGNIVWEKDDFNNNTYIETLLGVDDGFLTFGIISNGNNGSNCFVDRYDPLGELQWSTLLDDFYQIEPVDFIQTNDNGFAALMHGHQENIDSNQIVLSKLTATGELEWVQEFGSIPTEENASDFKQTQDNGFIIAGQTGVFPTHRYVIKTDENGFSVTNSISGNVFYDLNGNCQFNNEDTLEDWIVQAVGTQSAFYANTDSNGNYEIEVDQGLFEVSATMPSLFWKACAPSTTVDLSNPYSSESVDIPVQTEEQCPFMNVSIHGAWGRVCAESTLYVSCTNIGTANAEMVSVEILLDDFYQYLSVSGNVNLINQSDNLYTFLVGDVNYLESIDFTIQLQNDCDPELLEQTACIEATVYPDSTCLPINPLWTGAELELSAECTGNEVLMTIKNIGDGDMDAGSNYIVVEDDVIMLNEPFDPIASGESISFSRIANGTYQRIETNQVPFHPFGNMPIAFVEGCGVDINGEISTGFVNQYPLGDDIPFNDINCNTIVNSYDPNIKLAFPSGYHDEHFIEKNTKINYALHFQNVGNAPAFDVLLTDMLSEHLDPSTIVIGNSSHPYTFKLSGEGMMEFTFNNINLPDSISNPEGSQGFVTFTIDQKKDLPIGTQIFNEANIYFDFNPAIRTNETMHTIGENFITVNVEDITIPNVAVKVFPNPFTTSATFEISSGDSFFSEALTFELYDMVGRKVYADQFSDGTYILNKGNLTPGNYFYMIRNSSKVINSGKVIFHKL